MARTEPWACGSAGLLVLLLTAMPAAAREPAPAVEAEADSMRGAAPAAKAVAAPAQPAAPREPAPAVEAEADSMRGAAPAAKAVAAPVQPASPAPQAEADSVHQAGGRLSPRAALVRSALVPGWGQAATGHWLKALLFSGAGAGWLTAAVVESPRVGDALTPQEHEDRVARRNTRVLLYLVTVTLSAVDAYVDAHLEDFEVDGGDLESPGVRLTVRWGP